MACLLWGFLDSSPAVRNDMWGGSELLMALRRPRMGTKTAVPSLPSFRPPSRNPGAGGLLQMRRRQDQRNSAAGYSAPLPWVPACAGTTLWAIRQEGVASLFSWQYPMPVETGTTKDEPPLFSEEWRVRGLEMGCEGLETACGEFGIAMALRRPRIGMEMGVPSLPSFRRRPEPRGGAAWTPAFRRPLRSQAWAELRGSTGWARA